MMKSNVVAVTVAILISLSACSLLSSRFKSTNPDITICLPDEHDQRMKRRVRFNHKYIAEYDKNTFFITEPHVMYIDPEGLNNNT